MKPNSFMREKIIVISIIGAIFIGLIAFIAWSNSTAAPVQGDLADPVRGDATATVTIEEYSDFQCPACKSLEPTLKQILQEFPGQVKLIYNDYPLRQLHPNGAAAAEAAQCADAQQRFWDYHDLLFQYQSAWAVETDPTVSFISYAEQLGLDITTFQTCLDSDSTLASIQQDETEGAAAKISSTPTIFVNGDRMVGPSYDELRKQVAAALGQ